MNRTDELKIESPSFADNEFMPKKHTGFGEDVSPAFNINGLKEDVVSLAIVMDDIDNPMIEDFNHWVIWNIPKTEFISEGIEHGALTTDPVSSVQGVAYGKHMYKGPKQPFFILRAHRYKFHFYALDTMLSLEPEADKVQLLFAMRDHILQEGSITGKYKR